MNPLKRLLRAAGVLLVVAIGWTPQGVAVLCVVPGGHVAVEPGQDRCVPVPGAAHHDAEPCDAGFAQAGTCCAPCEDIPLGAQVLARGGGFRDQAAGAPAGMCVSAAVPGTLRHEPRPDPLEVGLRGTASPSRSHLLTLRLRC